MRVIVYVPSVSGVRVRRSVARDVIRLGHDIAGFASTPGDARWGLDEWKADAVAGRGPHLLRLVQDHPDLAGRILVVRPTARALLLLPLAGLVWLRRHPRLGVAGAGVAAAVVVAALTLSPDRHDALPPAPGVTSSAPAQPSSPADPRGSSRTPARPPGRTTAPPRAAPPPSRTVARPAAPSRTPLSQRPSRPVSPTVSNPPPTTPAPTPPAAAEPEQLCLLDLRLLGIKANLCIG